MGYNSYIDITVEKTVSIDLLEYKDEVLGLLKHLIETKDMEWLEEIEKIVFSNRRVPFDLDFSLMQFPLEYLIKTLGEKTLEDIKEVCNES